MSKNSLERAMEAIHSSWGPLGTELVEACQSQLEQLLRAQVTEPWLSALHSDAPANTELYRDPQHDFLLLAHTEQPGLYRAPHDHGRGWVIYALQQGEIQMRTFARVESADGRVKLVKRDSTLVRPGQVQVYLPGDIHDTRCVSGPALLLRFTERDLRKEDREEHRVTRYTMREGAWVPGAP